MSEVVGITGLADDGAGGIVRFPAGDRLPRREGLLDFGDGGIASVANGVEYGLLLRGRLAIDNPGPRDVIEGDVFTVGARPDIDQQEVSGADGSVRLRGRLIVRVGTVRIDRYVGAMFPDQAGIGHGALEPLDHGVLRGSGAGAHTTADLAEAGLKDGVDLGLRLVVALLLLGCEDSLEATDEIGGADDGLAQLTKDFDGAGVYHRDVHDGIARRVLHGDALCSREHVA